MSELDRVDNAMAMLMKTGIDAAAQGLGTARQAAMFPVKTAALAAGKAVNGIRKYPRYRESMKASAAARKGFKYERPSTRAHAGRQSQTPVHPGRAYQIAAEL